MNIGIFTDCYYPQINGVVTSVMMLQEELEKRGHKVTIITVKVPHHIEESINVIRIKSIPIIRMNEFRLGISFNVPLIRMIKALELDLVHTHTEFSVGLFGKYMAKILDVPLVHTYHTMYEDYTHYIYNLKYGQRVVKKMVTKSCKVYAKKYSCIIAPTDKTLVSLRKYGIKNDIHILPTGIDIDKFAKIEADELAIAALRRKYHINESDFVLLSLGRISKEKNIEFLLGQMPELTKLHKQLKLVIVGDGPYLNPLLKQYDALNLDKHVIFVGRVPYEEIGQYYKMADVFVSASYTETQGLTIIEAMASELGVVVYDDTNVKGIVMEGESGRLFKTESELKHQITDAINHPSKTVAMRERGLEIVKSLSKESYAENAEKIYNLLVEKHT
ncbi:glycosyltransferase family 4 protein [Petrocella sp. FN5]|uniref:glycosyltransferase family 4 protein n=1 Tax=Petrocella sp. FN5 TaxID=3032002 RepID=UPI0023DAA382|nr:glycosyltransferase family 4 protein [Petrocella sp. FN5]MDF1615888.1 glycosyltransferase family 4 protein [Petrocella sp. FN5]